MTLGVRVEHFQARVLQDALGEATAVYWRRRARAFEDAAPRPGDFTGAATAEDLAAARGRCREAALACRRRAEVESWPEGREATVAEVAAVLGEVAA